MIPAEERHAAPDFRDRRDPDWVPYSDWTWELAIRYMEYGEIEITVANPAEWIKVYNNPRTNQCSGAYIGVPFTMPAITYGTAKIAEDFIDPRKGTHCSIAKMYNRHVVLEKSFAQDNLNLMAEALFAKHFDESCKINVSWFQASMLEFGRGGVVIVPTPECPFGLFLAEFQDEVFKWLMNLFDAKTRIYVHLECTGLHATIHTHTEVPTDL